MPWVSKGIHELTLNDSRGSKGFLPHKEMNGETSTKQRVCLQCGALCEPRVSFCRQCGTSLRTGYDDEATSVITRKIGDVEVPPFPDPDKLWQESQELAGKVVLLQMEGRDEEASKLNDRAMYLYIQALDHGLQGKDEVMCRWLLGNALYDRAIELDEQCRLSNEPLGQMSMLSQGVANLERAIELDAKLGNLVFSNKENQADLLKLDLVWGLQASYIENKYGTEPAITYIVDKIKVTQHLKVLLPNLFYSWGHVYAKAGRVANALDMFRAATKAEDYGDVISHEDWRYRTAQIVKQNAAKNLQYLEVHGSAPSADQPDANELYEQALAAGDAQEYEKGIRLLDACLCSMRDPVIAMTGFFNLFVMIQLEHNFANRHGDSVPNDEFRWFCRMVLCVKKAIGIYETQLANRLTGDALEEVKAIYGQAKQFMKTNGITYGTTCRDSSGNLSWRDFKKVYAANAFPLASIEKEERQEANKALRN
jgi:tetratricopeptide (TPR) repeat protein/ribosomal protein L40E